MIETVKSFHVDEIYQPSGKQDSFRNVSDGSANIYESFGSQFFRATTGIPSRPDTFDESMLVFDFFTNLGVTWILCSFKLILKGKGVKKYLNYDN